VVAGVADFVVDQPIAERSDLLVFGPKLVAGGEQVGDGGVLSGGENDVVVFNQKRFFRSAAFDAQRVMFD